jgi:hypothetical protein
MFSRLQVVVCGGKLLRWVRKKELFTVTGSINPENFLGDLIEMTNKMQL